MTEQANEIAAMRAWVDDVVIAHNFCPFARFIRTPERIRYHVCASDQAAEILEQLYQECRHLDTDEQTATTLIIIPQGVNDFSTYLDVLSLGETLLRQWGYEGKYQLASFHPDYCFEGDAPSSPGNFTNRSPYPAFHLIREADIEKAMGQYPEPVDAIYERNIEEAQSRGCTYFQNLLDKCKHAR